MKNEIRGTRWSCAALAIAAIAIGGCSAKRSGGATTSTRSALTTGNGFGQNGLTTNGIWSNGIWSNGIWSNGIWSNGIWSNGIWSNGIWSNGIWSNGIWSNGIWSNGIWSNGIWSNGLTGTAKIPGDTLRKSVYGRQLLQYVYSCAMPAPTTDSSGDLISYDTTLDPNLDLAGQGGLPCSTPSADGGASCDEGYTCSSTGMCVIPLNGAIGLGINDDGTTWWGQPAPGGATDTSVGKWGQCDESCQRWVSACVLARTNAYGVHVEISMRAPAGAPADASPGRQLQFAAVKAALAVSEVERHGNDAGAPAYSLREGSFYGNIFATTPVSTDKGPCTTLPDGTVNCEAIGAIASTPAFYACAGPGSNIPALTKRFCSSQGDRSVINVPGVCLTNTSQAGVCSGEDTDPDSDTFGAISGCLTSTLATATLFNEVITVFLKDPIAVCGNAVCEQGEAATCPSDCHPGSWVKNYDPTFETFQTEIPPLDDPFPNFADYSMAALAPDDSVVVLGDTTATVDLDGVFLPVSSGGAGILVKYNADGSYAWPGRGVRFNNTLTTTGLLRASGITVAPSGNITVVGTSASTATTLWFSTFSAAGTQLVTRTWALGATVMPGRAVSVDSLGNTYIAGYLNGTATFPTTPPKTLTGGYGQNIFLMKVSPTGAVLFADLIPGKIYVASLTNDRQDNTLLTTWQSSDVFGPSVLKKCADPTLTPLCADGSKPWSKDFGGLGHFTAVAADASGNVYAGGFFGSNTDFGGGPRPMTGFPPSLVKYDRNGIYQWDKQATVICSPAGCSFGSTVYPTNISFDPAGNVVLATWGTPSIGGGIDFGFGTFPTYATSNIFLSAYQPLAPGSLKWAKQIPGVLGINARGIGLDSVGRVVVSGTFGGSMVVDDVMLSTGLTEDPYTVNPFVASFGGPPPGDNQAPDLGHTIDPTGAALYTVPQDIYVQATKPTGADVFYMPPTAIDEGHAGTSVVCWPPPNSTFHIGITIVTCTASDPRGNDSIASFTVTVADKVGPIFSRVADITVEAPDAGGATVTYPVPTATDQISGGATVTCTPPSGLFSVGHHTVTCTAQDASRNPSSVTFDVDVTLPGIGAPCLSTTDCSAGTCVDGVCCNTTGTSCGQCQACDTAGARGTCTPTSGGACDDGNACTRTDTCQAGSCAGTNPLTCAASDQCHVAGSCDPSTGACSNPAAPNGTACSDGSACTQTDTCQAGTCAGGNLVTCAASNQCHVAGSCDPSTGACSNPAAPNGSTCSDGNACTAGDVCTGGSCTGGGAVNCDDQNPCTVDSCDGISGCASTAGNAGVTCRAAANACDSAEVCTGTSASCPVSSDKLPPTLAPGTNQTVVGNCSGRAVVFAVPPLVSSSCEGGTTVTCTWTSGSSQGTCAKSGAGTSLPGNRYGAFTISCTAKDAGGTVSAPVVFTVTVLQPLSIRIQPPLSGDNNTVDNIVKLGSTVPNKVRLYACGSDVTRTASVFVKLATTYVSSGGSTRAQTIAATTNTPDTGGVMILDGSNYRYNLSTKGLSVTAGIPAFYQESITAAYKSAPSVVVGSDNIQLDIK